MEQSLLIQEIENEFKQSIQNIEINIEMLLNKLKTNKKIKRSFIEHLVIIEKIFGSNI